MHEEEQNISDLIEEILELKNSNKELIKKLNSKRYKFIDRLVDSAYRIKRVGKKNCQPEVKIQSDISEKYAREVQRKIEKGRIDIINVNFYDWDGKVLFKGGAERYVYDLACLLKNMGYKPRIIQGAHETFEKTYSGIKVVGVKSAQQDMISLSRIYANYCRGAELVIASPLELAAEIRGLPIIAINHGVNFDTPHNTFLKTEKNNYEFYTKALRNCSLCVCVDTNFINWVRTRDYATGMKLKYVPNYYDKKVFKVRKAKAHKKLVFTYPRRIYSARGSDITIEAFTKVLEKYKDKIELRFVGQINDDETRQQLENLINAYPDNVTVSEYKMADMYKAYSDTDVVMIPTRYSEGTSLSCIEGLASGNAVIATNIGGLPNLIIDGFNGLLISPSAEELEKAVVKLIKNPGLIKKFSKNGSMVAENAFTKDLWEQRWKNIIDNIRK